MAAAAIGTAATPPPADALVVTGVRGGAVAPFDLPSGLALDPTGLSPGSPDPCTSWATPFPLSALASAASDHCLVTTLDAQGPDPARILFALPAGTGLHPESQIPCSAAQFAAGASTVATCPPETQVGTLTVRVLADDGHTFDLTGRVHALDAPGALGGTLGVAPDQALEHKATATLLRGPTGEAIVSVGDLPASLPSDIGPQHVRATGVALRLWGAPSAHVRIDALGQPRAMAAVFATTADRCDQEQIVTVTAVGQGEVAPPQASSFTYPLSGCSTADSATPSASGRSSQPAQALPPVVPYFGTQRSRQRRGTTIGYLRSAYFTGLPAGTEVVVRCVQGCGGAQRSATVTIDASGAARRALRPRWKLRDRTRLTVTANLQGARPVVQRYRFLVHARTVRSKLLPP